HRRARRSFSQNFLSDPAAARTVVEAAALKPDDLVYEVGAGRGQLTRLLLAAAGGVVAYEVDPAMARALPREVVRNEDFLRARPPSGRFVMVGNLPYSLTSAVVEWCLRAPTL